MSVFWDERKMELSGRGTASILAVGDSWFWYPMFGGSLANDLGELVDLRGHVILAKGMNGAEAEDFVDGKYKDIVSNALRLYGSSLSAVFISGGGNDFAGFNDLRPLLKPDCSNEVQADGCFLPGTGGIEAFFKRIDKYYRALIGLIYTRTSLDCHVVMHCYDYALPNGKGVFGKEGWIQPALLDAGVPLRLHQACVNYLIDSLFKILSEIARGDPLHLHVVDSRGTLDPGDWANELHPKDAGFKKLAQQRWYPLLRRLNLA